MQIHVDSPSNTTPPVTPKIRFFFLSEANLTAILGDLVRFEIPFSCTGIGRSFGEMDFPDDDDDTLVVLKKETSSQECPRCYTSGYKTQANTVYIEDTRAVGLALGFGECYPMI